MWNKPTKERLQQIPGLYKTEETPLSDKLIYLHLFIGGCDWYVTECDGHDICWGFVILNGDLRNAEWGYFSLSELEQIKIHSVEVDCELEEFWQIRQASEVRKIAAAQGWLQVVA